MIERSPGVWQVQVSLGNVGGERRRVSRTVRGSKKDAQRVLAQLTLAPPTSAGGRTVAVLLDAWMPVARSRIQPTTARKYEDLVERMIKPQLGGVPLDRLSAMLRRHHPEAAQERSSARRGARCGVVASAR